MKRKMVNNYLIIVLATLLISPFCLSGQSTYSFKEVSELPIREGVQDPFLGPGGTRVQTTAEWARQREYIKQMLTYYQYGEMPPKPEFSIEPISKEVIFGDSVVQELFYVVLTRHGKTAKFKAGIRRPNYPDAFSEGRFPEGRFPEGRFPEGPFPVIIKNDRYVFSLSDIPNVSKREHYREIGRAAIEDFTTREAYRRGYIICKFIRDEVALDNADYRNSGVFLLYPEYNWGTIAAWAWAYQIIIDYLETLPYVDSQKIVATGHSRGGKTALCAGVYDERISVTAPNSSGSGGTGSWRFFDLTHEQQVLKYHQQRFPHWWTSRLFNFVGKEEKMPFDAHFQKAAIAPRGLVNPHSREDYWANPYGTYLTYRAANVVFEWLGADGHQGVHWRNGPHNQNQKDWIALFEFCDQYFFQEDSTLDFSRNPHPDKYHYPELINFTAPKE